MILSQARNKLLQLAVMLLFLLHTIHIVYHLQKRVARLGIKSFIYTKDTYNEIPIILVRYETDRVLFERSKIFRTKNKMIGAFWLFNNINMTINNMISWQ